MIDTLRYTKELELAGLTSEQAELMVKNHFLMIADHVATKGELKEFEYSMKLELKNLNSRIDELEGKLIVKLGGITVASMSAMTAFLGVLMIFIQK